jgi:membrane-bound lytic murein transglycosylase D
MKLVGRMRKRFDRKGRMVSLLVIGIQLFFACPSIAQHVDSLAETSYTYEFIPDASYDIIAERLETIEGEVPLSFNVRVKSFIDYFTIRDREYTKKVMRKSTYYFPLFERILEKHDLPAELKYLAVVESGLNATARSRASAVGLWQFMYYTGRTYGLHADWYIDERMDPEKSTVAAAMYIKSLYAMFDDWELALAAYNCGPGNVRKAIRRSGYKKSFWEIYRYLPRETRGYVPQFVAITYALNFAEEHNLIIPEEEYQYQMASDTVMVKNFTNLKTVAHCLDICEDDLETLNLSLKRNVLPEGAKRFIIRLPSDKMDAFRKDRKEILDSAGKVGKKRIEYLARNSVGSTYGRHKVVHKVRSGDVLGKIAMQYHVRVADIKKWNNLRSNTIRIGQRLNIWLLPHGYQATAQKPRKQEPQNVVINGSKFHVVQPGDTLWDISRLYQNVSIEQIKKLNDLKSNKIKPGQKLMIG